MTSATQDRWAEITEGLREALVKKSQEIPKMETVEVGALIECFEDVYTLDVMAHCFDANVQSEGGEICTSR